MKREAIQNVILILSSVFFATIAINFFTVNGAASMGPSTAYSAAYPLPNAITQSTEPSLESDSYVAYPPPSEDQNIENQLSNSKASTAAQGALK
jgi:hypothetical protein